MLPKGELAQLVERPESFREGHKKKGELAQLVEPREDHQKGELAQLVERLHGMQEVTGSNPVFSTSFSFNFLLSTNSF